MIATKIGYDILKFKTRINPKKLTKMGRKSTQNNLRSQTLIFLFQCHFDPNPHPVTTGN